MKYVAVVLGIAAAATIATLSAVASPSKSTPLELVLSGSHEAVPQGPEFPFGIRHRGTFTASLPFCPSGIFWDLTNDLLNSLEDTRLYTCADGSGTLTTQQEDWFEHKPPYAHVWRILDGTGRYADLRGKGTFRGGLLTGNDEDPLSVLYGATYTGVVAFDTLAPTIAVAAARVTKLRRPAETYSIRLGLSIGDDAAQDGVSFFAAAEPEGGGVYLAKREGSTTTGRVTLTLRITPVPTAKTVLLHVRAEDAVGNWRWVTRRLKLPR